MSATRGGGNAGGPDLEHEDDDEFYNGGSVHVSTIPASTILWRFTEIAPRYRLDSFRPEPPPLVEQPTSAQLGAQGRFDPIDRSHGGFLYCSSTLAGAIAEGILRMSRLPASRVVPAKLVDGRMLVRLRLNIDLDVADLRDPYLTGIGLSSAVHSCARKSYGWSRRVGHAILDKNRDAHGLSYPCRHNTRQSALLLIQRAGGPLADGDAISLLDQRKPVEDRKLRSIIADVLARQHKVRIGDPNPEDD